MKTKFILVGIILLALVGLGLLIGFPGAVAQEKEGGEKGAKEMASSESKNQDECKALARDICARFGQLPGPDSVCSFKCRVTTELTDTSLGAKSVNDLQIVLNRDCMHLSSDMLEVYRDTLSVVTVLPYLHAVYIYDSPTFATPAADPKQWLWTQDKLLVNSLVTECGEQTDDKGIRYKRMTFSPTPDFQRALNIRSFSMVLDIDNKHVSEVSLVPLRPAEYQRMTWSLSEIRYGDLPDELEGPVIAQVVDGHHRLRDRYVGYTLEDNRYIASADAKR